MKYLLTISICAIYLNLSATHRLSYYVYFETEYLQGPWKRSDLLEGSNYKYLAPKSFTDLFGSLDEDLVTKFIDRLKENSPERYNWQYQLSFQGDTVVLESNANIDQVETVKNEITATLTLNCFKVVSFNFGNVNEVWTMDDLTLPYFDLVQKKLEQPKMTTEEEIDLPHTTEIAEKKEQNSPLQQIEIEEEKSGINVWLLISVLLNLGLVVILLMNRKRK